MWSSSSSSHFKYSTYANIVHESNKILSRFRMLFTRRNRTVRFNAFAVCAGNERIHYTLRPDDVLSTSTIVVPLFLCCFFPIPAVKMRSTFLLSLLYRKLIGHYTWCEANISQKDGFEQVLKGLPYDNVGTCSYVCMCTKVHVCCIDDRHMVYNIKYVVLISRFMTICSTWTIGK